MTKKLFLSMLFLLTGCASMSDLPEQKTVDYVDIQKYMGDWNVIGTIPTMFDGDYNPVESYTWNEKEKRVDIDYSYNKDSFDGKKKHIPQKGFIANETTHATWKVQVWWPFKSDYLILDLAPDYSDVIVGVPSRSYAWIMSRKTTMPEARYQEQVAKLKSLGYDVSKIKKPQHNH